MRYRIRMTVECDYGAPSDHVRTVVRVVPTDRPGWQVVTGRLLSVDPPPGERRESADFFGNTMTTLAFHQPVARIGLTLEARATRLTPAASLDLSPDLPGLAAEVAAARDLSSNAPHHYLGPSPRVPADPAIAAFARGVAARGMTAVEVVTAVGHALHAEMRFEAGATDVHTVPSAAFRERRGVCQDFSHIMIGALRALGVPAGYVSGFLRTRPPPGRPRLEGVDAMHAWVSAWCGSEAGWIEYDPTNAAAVALDHVSVAYGRDYGDCAPMRGSLRTSGRQASRHHVDVEPLDGASAA